MTKHDLTCPYDDCPGELYHELPSPLPVHRTVTVGYTCPLCHQNLDGPVSRTENGTVAYRTYTDQVHQDHDPPYTLRTFHPCGCEVRRLLLTDDR